MRWGFPKPRPAGRVALGRSGSMVYAAAVERTAERPRVLSCSAHALQDDTQQAWIALIKRAGLVRKRSLLLLSDGEYMLTQVQSPNVPEAERKQAVVWSLKDMLPYPVEQATVDVVVIPQGSRAGGHGAWLYAVAARNEVIRRYMEIFHAAGAVLEVIDIPELAQRNIAALLEEPGRGIALLSFNEDGGLLTFTADGELYHARSIEIPLHQITSADAAQRSHALERLVLELQRSLDNFERQFSHIAISRLVLGPMVGQAALEEQLREYLYVPVSSLDLSQVMNLAAVEELQDPAFQAGCLLALGAALREEPA